MSFCLRSWLTGFALGLSGAPYPYSAPVPVAYLYNGIRLPALPEWDREKYPYFIVLPYISGSTFNPQNMTMLYLSTSKFSRKVFVKESVLSGEYNDYWFYAETDGDAVYYTYQPSTETEWTRHEYRDTEFLAGELAFNYSNADVCLANFDVKNYDDGTVYLPAAEPIPVYE